MDQNGSSEPTVPTSVEAKLVGAARDAAVQLGDAEPTSAALFTTDLGTVLRALEIPTEGDPDIGEVYVLVVEGDFKVGRRLRPDTGPAGTGRFSVHVYDKETLRPLRWALRDDWRDEGQFGDSRRLSLDLLG